MKLKKITKLFGVFALCGLLSVPIFKGLDNNATQVKADSSGETWIINEEPDIRELDYPGFDEVPFTCNNMNFGFFYVAVGNVSGTIPSVLYYNDGEGNDIDVYNDRDGWTSEVYRTISFDTSLTGDLLDWFELNAVLHSTIFVTIQYEGDIYSNLNSDYITISVNVLNDNYSNVSIYNNNQLLFHRNVNDWCVINYLGGYENVFLHDEGNSSYVPLLEYFSFYLIDKQPPFQFSFREPDYSEDESYLVGYNDGYNQGRLDGILLGQEQSNTATRIFSGILEVALVPINFFLAILNFEIFGINISAFVTGIITIVLTIIVIRTITGKGGD